MVACQWTTNAIQGCSAGESIETNTLKELYWLAIYEQYWSAVLPTVFSFHPQIRVLEERSYVLKHACVQAWHLIRVL
jgi:hypothetical protein